MEGFVKNPKKERNKQEIDKVEKQKTIHTSRTMMFVELSKVMDHAIHDDIYIDSLNQNIVNKKTKNNQDKTTGYLKQLYGFNLSYQPFKFFKYFWQISAEKDKPLLTLLFAIGQDYLLGESYVVIASTKLGDKVTIEKIQENIEGHHPNKFSENTKRSLAQNIASSWKQAGFISGKVKNIRVQPEIGYHAVAYAFLLAYCNGDRGDFILTSKWVKALCLSDSHLREIAIDASKRDLLQYQFAGSVTAISFTNLFTKLGIDGIQS
ncbi:hypothetical protein [Chitinophaga sancti]|uniref:Uncharacterized protein n=1 Tax=Chitinophaga sancti TaxID=1004 RepID=A0A1K1T204_9BACT|nr:hypothetical protein [Chitinophaga sancti]WQD60997.1 hypothetical protein U0033_24160 [Chitinophaga sancti]WQG86876.1 hypothetical protein SR876_18315 [Chitinophaga sancti]SFW90367.1 hypothetical protein SAMN05661012_06599 [Chitinophaga sancti]